jgi:hypothetical protein
MGGRANSGGDVPGSGVAGAPEGVAVLTDEAPIDLDRLTGILGPLTAVQHDIRDAGRLPRIRHGDQDRGAHVPAEPPTHLTPTAEPRPDLVPPDEPAGGPHPDPVVGEQVRHPRRITEIDQVGVLDDEPFAGAFRCQHRVIGEPVPQRTRSTYARIYRALQLRRRLPAFGERSSAGSHQEARARASG